MRESIKISCQKRLNRIEGQVRGLSRMVDEDRYCIDIVTQISAVRAALRRVEEEVLKDHVAHCEHEHGQRERDADPEPPCHVGELRVRRFLERHRPRFRADAVARFQFAEEQAERVAVALTQGVYHFKREIGS